MPGTTGRGAGSASSTCCTSSCRGSASWSRPSSPSWRPRCWPAGRCGATRSPSMPAEISGGPRPGDERFTAITGRRPFVEATVARVAAAEPGLEIVRGAAVTGLLTAAVERGRCAARQRRRHRRRHGAARRPRGRRQWPAFGAPRLAGGARRPSPVRGARGLRLRLLRPPLPLAGRLAARGLRPAVAALRVAVAAAPAGRQRHVGRRHRRQRRRPGDAGRPPSRRVGAGRLELPAGRPLARRRADLRRRRDGQDRGPLPALRRRRRSGGHRASWRWATRGPARTRPSAGARRSPCSTPCACATSSASWRRTTRRSPSGGTR